MTKRALLAAVFCCLSSLAFADYIDTKWSVVGWTGEAWFVEPKNVIGRTQMFHKGEAKGVFYGCDFAGQSSSYTTYETVDEFLANPEFKVFKAAEKDLKLSGPKVFVHRITCEGNGRAENRRVLYPFVTTEKRHSAYYPFEGGFFTLYSP